MRQDWRMVMGERLTTSRSSPLTRWVPAFAWLECYESAWLQADVVAGLTAAAVVVPQAMAYGAIAGLPLVVGLYTALVPLVVYAVMGTSRPLSVTTTSTIALLTAGALHQVVPGANDEKLIVAAGVLACLVGAVLITASALRLGIVASFISEPVLTGFKAGGSRHRGGSDSEAPRRALPEGPFLSQPDLDSGSSAAGVHADDGSRSGDAGAAARIAELSSACTGIARDRGDRHHGIWPGGPKWPRHRVG